MEYVSFLFRTQKTHGNIAKQERKEEFGDGKGEGTEMGFFVRNLDCLSSKRHSPGTFPGLRLYKVTKEVANE